MRNVSESAKQQQQMNSERWFEDDKKNQVKQMYFALHWNFHLILRIDFSLAHIHTCWNKKKRKKENNLTE